jgi:DNA invertase Pin-like site-specific DNA recombinase
MPIKKPPKASCGWCEGVYKGRKPVIDVAKVRKLKAEGMGASEIADTLGCGRSSIYRASAR